MRRLIIIPLLLIPWLVSSALAVPPAPSSPRAERIAAPEQVLRQGVEFYKAGEREEALSTLRGFLLRYPDSPLVSEASLYLARIFYERGEMQDALLYLQRIPPERRGAAARLLEGAALVGTGETAQGVALLQAIPTDSLTPADRKLRLFALAEGSARTEKPLSALSYLHRSLPEAAPGEGERILEQSHVLLRERLSDPELAEAVAMFSGTAIGEDARLQQARRALARGETERAEEIALSIVQGSVAFPYRGEAIRLLSQIKGGGASTDRTIGVILPLSGRFAAFGDLVRRGVELALENHPASVGVHFIDGEGDAESCARIVGELAADPKVMAIAGPLTSAAAAAAATRAQKEKLPIITLSQREGLPRTGNYVFRLSLTSSAQVNALVEYAMGERGMTSFAVLAPETRLGKEMADLFSKEVERRGGKVAVRAEYAEGATDFKPQVRLLSGRGPKPAKGAPPPKTDAAAFQALFIPDTGDRLALIVPQLAFYGLQKVQLLGTNGWNSPQLRKTAGRHLEGAVFVDGFFPGSPAPAVAEFVRTYREKHQSEPSILEAQGYDVAGILQTVLADPALRTREDVRRALSALPRYPGVTGATIFDGEGEAQRSLFLLQVRGGEVVQIN